MADGTLAVEMNPVMSDSDRDAVTDDEAPHTVAEEVAATPTEEPQTPESPDAANTEDTGLINTNSPSDKSDDVEKRISNFSKQRTQSLPPSEMAPTPPTDSPREKPNPLLRTSTPKAIAPTPPQDFPGTTSATVLMGDDAAPEFHDLSHVACVLSLFLFWTVFAVLSFLKAKEAMDSYRKGEWVEYSRHNKRARQYMVASVAVAMVVLIIVIICVVALDASGGQPTEDVPENPI